MIRLQFTIAWPLALLIVISSTHAAEPGAAVKKGSEYLDGFYADSKNFGDQAFGPGGTALAGIALLESGIKPESPGLANIIKSIRADALSQSETYNVALCILFFDKLAEKTGDKSDESLLQLLGVRLYAGMNASGGWGYNTWDQVNQQEVALLAAALKKNELVTKPDALKPETPKPAKPDDGFLKPGQAAAPNAVPGASAKIHLEAAKLLVNVQQAIRARGRSTSGDDNSNTQFGLIALWVASRHGVPANDAFALIEARFQKTQSANDFGWSYTPFAGGILNSTPAMTCAGLLGLAVGAGGRNAMIAETKKDKPAPSEPAKDDPLSSPKAKPKVSAPAIGGKSAEAALSSLGKFLGATRPNNNAQIGALKNFVGSGNAYYTLWSIERVGMAYGLDTIGDVDWYTYGCGFLLPSQGNDGSWSDGMYNASVNTSFALLFLTKSNSVRDLSNKIKGNVRDPGKTELRAGAGANAPLFAPPPKEGASTGPKPGAQFNGPSFSLPEVISPNDAAEIEKIATDLSTADDATWKTKLAQVRDSKGTKFTRALIAACIRVEAERRTEAREALAERLTRMTSKTLREMMADSDPELRRAACLAAGMKEDKLLIPSLIDRISDPTESVVRAAKASLKSISQADYGPQANSDADAKAKAAATWRSWYEALPK